jgi:hypothetical protein
MAPRGSVARSHRRRVDGDSLCSKYRPIPLPASSLPVRAGPGPLPDMAFLSTEVGPRDRLWPAERTFISRLADHFTPRRKSSLVDHLGTHSLLRDSSSCQPRRMAPNLPAFANRHDSRCVSRQCRGPGRAAALVFLVPRMERRRTSHPQRQFVSRTDHRIDLVASFCHPAQAGTR